MGATSGRCESLSPSRDVDARGIDSIEGPLLGVDDPSERQPVGDAAFPTVDTLPGDSALDVWWVDADLDEPLCEEIGHLTRAELVAGQPPEVAYVDLSAVVDAEPRAVV